MKRLITLFSIVLLTAACADFGGMSSCCCQEMMKDSKECCCKGMEMGKKDGSCPKCLKEKGKIEKTKK